MSAVLNYLCSLLAVLMYQLLDGNVKEEKIFITTHQNLYIYLLMFRFVIEIC